MAHTSTQTRHPLAANQPNLIDTRPAFWGDKSKINGPVYSYLLNKDGSVHVHTIWAGMGDGIGAGGKRFGSIEEAAAAVIVARAKVSAKWSRKGRKYPAIPHSLVN